MAPNFYVLFVKSQNNGIEYFRCWFALGILLSLTIYTLCILYDQRSALNSKIYDLISYLIQRANLNKISSSTKIERITNFFGSDNLKNRRLTFLVIQIILGLVLYVWNVSSNYCNLININDNSLFCSVIKITKPIYFPAPAILYLLFILWFFTASLGLLTLWNNGLLFNNQKPKRIPTIMLLLGIFIFCIFSYAAFRADHTFVSLNTNNSKKSNSMEEFRTAVNKRIEKTKYKDTLVVIATAGGGIQASGWTAQVLSGLQSSIGEDFTKAIGLISSTSGGSIGTMFYLDQFDEDKGILSQDGLKNVVKSATNNWLPAVGWGLAYPDLVRVLGLPFLNFGGNAVDRGSSLEQLWINDLKHKNKEAMTLSSLHTKIMNGTIPIPIFNSTIVENGHRLLISPLSFPVNNINNNISEDFKSKYPDCDFHIATLARLSASFPYVTPSPRIEGKACNKEKKNIDNDHIIDGGFFDNYGTYTAVEFLDKFLNQNICKIKKVIIIQIESFPEDNEDNKNNGSFFTDTLGPLFALLNVRDATQKVRNQEEIQLLKQRWEGKVCDYKIIFPSIDKYKPPLSWQLSKDEQDKLKEAWNHITNNTDQINSIKKEFENHNLKTCPKTTTAK